MGTYCNPQRGGLSFWPMATQMLTLPETAARLALHPETVRRMIGRGELAAVKVGRHWRVPESALEKLEAVATANTSHSDDDHSGD